MAATRSLVRYAWLSVAAALVTMGMKALAYLVTGSVGLLSDALESSVNLVAALVAVIAIRIAERPADEEHAFGHAKAEYFSAGVEGGMIFVAALAIFWTSIDRLLNPVELSSLGIGLVVSTAAALVNLGVALVLLRAGRAERSITLEADGRHLLTDVWTSGGVLVGVGLVALTGWEQLDPIVGLLVGVNILWTGFGLLRRSASGLMDTALDEAERRTIGDILAAHEAPDVQFHALRTRQAGRRSFVSFHLLVPGAWTVQRGHDLAEELEDEIRRAVPGSVVFVHVEPLEDPRSFADEDLDRLRTPPHRGPT
jgi:cation diffusion facilitator family transporter